MPQSLFDKLLSYKSCKQILLASFALKWPFAEPIWGCKIKYSFIALSRPKERRRQKLSLEARQVVVPQLEVGNTLLCPTRSKRREHYAVHVLLLFKKSGVCLSYKLHFAQYDARDKAVRNGSFEDPVLGRNFGHKIGFIV